MIDHERTDSTGNRSNGSQVQNRSTRISLWGRLTVALGRVWSGLVQAERVRAPEFALEAATPRVSEFRDPRSVPSRRSLRRRG